MPKGYWIPHLDVSNPEGFQAYRTMADAAHERFGSVGEGTATTPAFQTSGNDDIKIPIGTGIPGNVTTATGARGSPHGCDQPSKASSSR